MRDFYVYAYLDPKSIGLFNYGEIEFGYEPFYIGKGRKNRCYCGINDKKKCMKTNMIKNIINRGDYPIILKIYSNLTENEAFEKEIFLISLIGRKDCKNGPLTNMTNGGDGSSGRKDTEKDTARKKLFRHKKEHLEKMSKPIIQYDLMGNIIAEYNSIKEAAEKTNTIKQNISSVLTGKYKTSNGFIWKYKKEEDILQGHLKESFIMPKHSEETKLKMSESAKKGKEHPMYNQKGINHPRSRKIMQLNLDGSHIKTWDSMQDIKRELGFNPSNISRCCKGDVKRIGGYLWKYYD